MWGFIRCWGRCQLRARRIPPVQGLRAYPNKRFVYTKALLADSLFWQAMPLAIHFFKAALVGWTQAPKQNRYILSSHSSGKPCREPFYFPVVSLSFEGDGTSLLSSEPVSWTEFGAAEDKLDFV